jgi:uncharacterized Zn-finger protein
MLTISRDLLDPRKPTQHPPGWIPPKRLPRFELISGPSMLHSCIQIPLNSPLNIRPLPDVPLLRARRHQSSSLYSQYRLRAITSTLPLRSHNPQILTFSSRLNCASDNGSVKMEAQSLSTCNVCGKKFQRKAHLLRHQQQRTSVNFDIIYCCAVHVWWRGLTGLAIDSGERPYSCKFCSKTFKRRYVPFAIQNSMVATTMLDKDHVR